MWGGALYRYPGGTLNGSVILFGYFHPSRLHNLELRKIYLNPIIFAQELSEEICREGLTQAELARKHGISRARVNQWLSLLKLPKKEIRRIQAMGDNWERRLLTERNLRGQY